jgi:hypothetical protein
MCEHGIAASFFQDGRFGLGTDTLNLARKVICDDKSGIGIPSAYNLPTLFQFVTRMLPLTSHCAMADVKATSTIFRFQNFLRPDFNVFSSSPKGKKRLEFMRQDCLSMIPNQRVQATANVMSPFLPHHQLQRRKITMIFL